MTIKDAHDRLQFYVDKAEAGYFSPEERDRVLHDASIWRFNLLKSSYAKDEKVKAALSPFRKRLTYATDGAGLFVVDTAEAYELLVGMNVIVYNNELARSEYFDVTFPNDDERAQALNSQLNPVSAKNPIGEEFKDSTNKTNFQLIPNQAHAGELMFLRTPKKPVFSYTIVGRAVTHNAGASTNPEWQDTEMNQIILKAAALLGINLQDEWIRESGIGLTEKSNA